MQNSNYIYTYTCIVAPIPHQQLGCEEGSTSGAFIVNIPVTYYRVHTAYTACSSSNQGKDYLR